MSKEGSTEAPIRHPIDFEHPDFLDPKKLDDEMRRVFDICHGCRRCFNLCDSFPKLFDMIDESKNEDVDSLSSDQFSPVVDACTLCDMCFMTKCPYVPPHDFDLDFPHLMLRYRTAQKKLGKLPSVPTQLAKIDRNAKIGVMFSKIVNWASSIKNKLFRKILEIIAGIDKRMIVGMAGILDSARFKFFLSNELSISTDSIQTMVLGGHGDTMVPLPRYTTVSGIPITQLLDSETIEQIGIRTAGGGGEIVKLLERGSAFYAPGNAAAVMAESILEGESRVVGNFGDY